MESNPKFVNVDNYPIIRKVSKKEGETCRHWFLMDREEYLLKTEDLFICYLETFCALILNNINILSVNYHLAKYHGNTGVITPNYNPNHYETINLETIILSYEKHLRENGSILNPNFLCCEQLKKMIFWYFSNEKEEVIKKIYDGIFNHFMSSVFLGNTDLNSKNIEIYNPDQPTISPCYDYAKCFIIKYGFFHLSRYFLKYASYYQNDLSFDFEKPEKTLQKFLKFGERHHIEEFKEKLEKLKELNINAIVEQIENETESFIPKDINKKLLTLYRNNLSEINRVVKNQK